MYYLGNQQQRYKQRYKEKRVLACINKIVTDLGTFAYLYLHIYKRRSRQNISHSIHTYVCRPFVTLFLLALSVSLAYTVKKNKQTNKQKKKKNMESKEGKRITRYLGGQSSPN